MYQSFLTANKQETDKTSNCVGEAPNTYSFETESVLICRFQNISGGKFRTKDFLSLFPLLSVQVKKFALWRNFSKMLVQVREI